jgi:hypothetical protein
MKISKKKLQKIIKEELEMAYSGPKTGQNDPMRDVNNIEIDPKEQLLKIATDALGLYCAIEDNDELEPWVESKITTINNWVSKVKSSLEAELQLNIPTPDMESAIESTKKEKEVPETPNYAGQGSYYYDV